MNSSGGVTSRSNFNIKAKLLKELRTFEPQGASDRKIKAFPSNYHRAMEDIRSMQYKYDQQRLNLRKHLNSPIKLIKNKSPEKIPPQHTKLSFSRFSPTRSYKELPPEQVHSLLHKRINLIMSSCKLLATENKSALRSFPIISQNTSEKFENFTQVVNRLSPNPTKIKNDNELQLSSTKVSKSSRISPVKLKNIRKKISKMNYL